MYWGEMKSSGEVLFKYSETHQLNRAGFHAYYVMNLNQEAVGSEKFIEDLFGLWKPICKVEGK